MYFLTLEAIVLENWMAPTLHTTLYTYTNKKQTRFYKYARYLFSLHPGREEMEKIYIDAGHEGFKFEFLDSRPKRCFLCFHFRISGKWFPLAIIKLLRRFPQTRLRIAMFDQSARGLRQGKYPNTFVFSVFSAAI